MRRSLLESSPAFLFLPLLFLFAETVWGAPLSLGEYQSRIQDGLNLVQSREGEIQREEVARLRELLPPELRVANERGEVIKVDLRTVGRWIQEAQSSPTGRKQLVEHLRALSEQLSWKAGALPLAGSEWRKSRLRLDEVYRAREFQHLQEMKPPAWRVFLDGVLRSLMEWLRDHISAADGISSKWIPYGAYVLLVLAGAVLILWILRSFGPVGWRWRHPSTGAIPEKEGAIEVDWLHFRAEAERKAQEGAFRDAIRAFYISVLMEGERKGWWMYRQEATNKEHLGRVSGPEERCDALRKLIDLYEEVWYGQRDPREEAFLNCKGWLSRMELAP